MEEDRVSAKKQIELPKVILFGDSLTAWSFDTVHGKGFGDVLTRHFEGRAEVLNEGWPGGTSDTMARSFTQIMSSLQQTTTPPLLITIFLGANDACLAPPSVHVPIDKYTSNIRSFVDSVLATNATQTTKILLITPPPINVRESLPHNEDGIFLEDEELVVWEQEWESDCRDQKGWQTWVSKKQYAERIVQIAGEYAEAGFGGRVASFDVWRVLINHGLEKSGQALLKDGPVDVRGNGKWPGCGLPGAKEFERGIFRDALHFAETGYEILSDSLMKLLKEKWPEIL